MRECGLRRESEKRRDYVGKNIHNREVDVGTHPRIPWSTVVRKGLGSCRIWIDILSWQRFSEMFSKMSRAADLQPTKDPAAARGAEKNASARVLTKPQPRILASSGRRPPSYQYCRSADAVLTKWLNGCAPHFYCFSTDAMHMSMLTQC